MRVYFCKSCKFVSVSAEKEYVFCPYCGQKQLEEYDCQSFLAAIKTVTRLQSGEQEKEKGEN